MTLFVCMYRPPSTSNEEWSQALFNVNEAIELAQSNDGYETIIMAGDYNFPDIKQEENFPRFDLNLNTQEENFVNFICDHNLMNYVSSPTRNGNILDLVLTNDTGLILDTKIDLNRNFSDHNTVSCVIDVNFSESQMCKKFTEYLTSVPKFG